MIRHAEKKGTYVVYARFKDQAAFEFHQEADFHHRLVPPILDCVEGEMDLQFFEWVASIECTGRFARALTRALAWQDITAKGNVALTQKIS